MRCSRNRRPALTLLEMVLTFAIAMLIMLALFMVMRSQYSHAQAGRDAIKEATLARDILTRLSTDLANTLGPVDPRFLPNSILPNNANTPSSGKSAGGGSGGSGAGGASNGSTGGSGAAAGTSSTGDSTSSSSTNSATTTPVPFNLGVKGDAKWLILSTSSVPGALIASPKAPVMDNSIISSDLRSLSFWLVDGGGLARREMTAVTADEAPTDAPSFADAARYVFAPEVQDVLFEYFDGASWQSSWDGGILGGSDGNTPIGPPAAIGITITLRSGGREGSLNAADAPTVQYKHVVALPATNALSQLTQSGQTSQASGQTLLNALQAGQQVPAPNLQNGTTQSTDPSAGSSGGSGM